MASVVALHVAQALRGLLQLAFLGIEFDVEKNKTRGEEIELSTPNSKVRVVVIPTDEEYMIARDTEAIVKAL